MMHLSLANEAATQGLGVQLAEILLACLADTPLMVYLSGDLGAGKTTLVRALIQHCGHTGLVKSPTYTLIEPYNLPNLDIYHLDLYRLADPEELLYLGFEDLVAPGRRLLLVEWPEQAAHWLPPADLHITLSHAAKGRTATLDAPYAPIAAHLQSLKS